MPAAELKNILLNTDEGAGHLLAKALDWMTAHPEALLGRALLDTLHVLRTTRPSMAAFAVLADRFEKHLKGPSVDVPAIVRQIREDVRRANDRVADRFAAILSMNSDNKVVTLSWSSTVLAALFRASEQIREIHVLESWPGGEGIRMAQNAENFAVRVQLHLDEDLVTAAEQATVGVIGADTIFSDQSILNKVLSSSLAESLYYQEKPLYVLATSWKTSSLQAIDYQPAEQDVGVFEVVPSQWITAIVTEDGMLYGGGHHLT